MTRSLRARLILSTAVLLCLVLALAAVAVYVLMRQALLAEFDAALLVEAKSLAAHFEVDEEKLNIEPDLTQLPQYSRGDDPHYFQAWDHEGKTIVKSPSLGELRLPRPKKQDISEHTWYLIYPPGGRAITLRFQPWSEMNESHEDKTPSKSSGKGPLSLVLARPTGGLESTLSALAWLLSGVTAAAVAAGVFLLNYLVHRELLPLTTLAHSISKVGVDAPADRIHIQDAPDELLPVVHRLDELLLRLDVALNREKSFTADVAHELRTPLAGLRSTLEVYASQPRDPAVYAGVLARCLTMVDGMQGMVNNLLLLARADARQLTTEPCPVVISELLQASWAPFAELARERGLSVTWPVNSRDQLLVDRDKAQLVFGNLLENAVNYSNAGGWIRIRVEPVGVLTRVSITNSGSRLSPEDQPKLFDRFWRGDEARSQTGLHTGLGLALSRQMVELMEGTIDVSLDGDVFTIHVDLPTAQ